MQLFSNNAVATLASPVDSIQTSLTLSSGDGELFNVIVAPDFELATLSDGTNYEIVKITARALNSDVLTVIRGQEATAPIAATAGAKVRGSVTAATLATIGNKLTVDNGGDAKGSNSVTIQTDRTAPSQVASGNAAIAVGSYTTASGNFSLAAGYYATAISYKSVAIGSRSNTYNIDRSLSINCLPSMQHVFIRSFSNEYKSYTGLVGLLQSEIVDLAGGSTWTASTALAHGHVAKSTNVALKNQFVWRDLSFDRKADPSLVAYTPASTGATEPTWPTSIGVSVTDGGGKWYLGISEGVGYTMNLAGNMLIDEIWFVAYQVVGITAQANISIGDSTDPIKYVNNQPTVGLTANNTVTRWTLAHPVIASDIVITINTYATGTQLQGHFVFKGLYMQNGNLA